ncbi:MAG: 1-acyl-sn-glycerol-3-phosphate acyltransferase [Actinomycetota bacterium]
MQSASNDNVIRLDARREPHRCGATTTTGRPCRNNVVEGETYCHLHRRQKADAPAIASSKQPIRDEESLEELVDLDSDASLIDRLNAFMTRRLKGDYPIDEFGYDEELSREILIPLLRPLYEHYFRVRTLGVSRIPSEGPALLVANHSGTIPIDAVMMQYAVATEHQAERVVRSIGADLVWAAPFVSHLARKTGNAVACDEDAYALLERDQLVAVFPEGFKGVGKGWSERYRLQRFGRGGFIEVALRARVPIVPVAIVGAEEAFPMVANAKVLASLLRFPYFPITPTFPLLGPLGLLPLPSRWVIEFGEPIPMDAYPDDAADDKMFVFDLTDSIRDRIQQMIYKGLKYRGGAFL